MSYLHLLALTGLAFSGALGGGLLAEPAAMTPRRLSLALHSAAGVVLAMVAADVVPETLREAADWRVFVSFFAGCVMFLLVDVLTGFIRNVVGGDDRSTPISTLYLGAAFDLLSDGLMLGAAASVQPGLVLMLAYGQLASGLPQAFAMQAALKQKKSSSRLIRVLLLAGLAIPMVAGMSLGWALLPSAPRLVSRCILAMTAGFLVTLTVEEVVPQAHEEKEARLSTLAFAAAFTGYLALSSLLR